VLIVSHGGVTVDLARTWFGDERVRDLAPGAIEHGIPACAVTRICLDRDGKTLHAVGDPASLVSAEGLG
jgi:broad specificity phosphatase PhoE